MIKFRRVGFSEPLWLPADHLGHANQIPRGFKPSFLGSLKTAVEFAHHFHFEWTASALQFHLTLHFHLPWKYSLKKGISCSNRFPAQSGASNWLCWDLMVLRRAQWDLTGNCPLEQSSDTLWWDLKGRFWMDCKGKVDLQKWTWCEIIMSALLCMERQ